MVRWPLCVVVLAVEILAAGMPGLAEGQSTQTTEPPVPPKRSGVDDIKQDKPDFLVAATVDRQSRNYREGDNLSIQAVCEVDAYIYVLYKQADGQVFQIYPNNTQPNNRVKARQAVRIPDPDDLFRWSIGPPFGKETIKVIASKEPLAALADPEFRRARFNKVAPEQVKGIELELGKEQPPPWAEDCVEIETFPKNHEFEASSGRRYGLFIGVSEFEFADQHMALTKQSMASPPSNRDARHIAKVMAEMGELSDYRILTNATATRLHLEAGIAGWLPWRSKPGDTVFIYFSGLAYQDTGTIAIYLEPYDFMTAEVLVAFFKQYKEGQLDKYLVPRVERLFNLVRSVGSIPPGGRNPLSETIGISDIVLTHWLQRLAGRQIVLILDVPAAGAFSAATKGDSPTDNESGLKSLKSDIVRLNELGQREIALLAATSAQGTSVVRSPDLGSWMTVFFCDAITGAAGTVTLDEAHRVIVERTDREGPEINRQRQAEGEPPLSLNRPLLFNTCTKPVYVKP